MDFPSKLLRAQKEASDQRVKGQENGGGQRKPTKELRREKQRGEKESKRERELLPNMSQFPITVPTFICSGHSRYDPTLRLE